MKPCPYCAEEIQEAAVKCKFCGEFLSADSSPKLEGGTAGSSGLSPKKFVRSPHDRKLSGVCGGIAVYAALDATLVRLLVALGILLTGILPGVILYVVAAMIVPEDGDVSR